MIPVLRRPSPSMRTSMPGGAAGRTLMGILLILWFLLPMVPVALWAIAGRWYAPAFLASALLGAGVAILATPLGFMAAVSIRRLPLRYARPVEGILLAPLAIPPFALATGNEQQLTAVLSLTVVLPPLALLTVLLLTRRRGRIR